MTFRDTVTALAVCLLVFLTAMPAAVRAADTPGELICMRDCIPRCLASGGGNSAQPDPSTRCEYQCKRSCGITNTFGLPDIREIVPPLRDLTGVIGPDLVVVCGGAACVCSGAESCNSLIAACPGEYILQCSGFDDIGQPTACSCVNAGPQ